MKKLQVTALLLVFTLGAGTLTACSSKEKTENHTGVSTENVAESTVSETETEESVETEEEAEGSLLETVLHHITVARVDSVQKDGTLGLRLFEVNQENTSTESEIKSEEESTASETEVHITEEANVQLDTFDFTSLDLSIFVESYPADPYLVDETAIIRMVVDDVLTEVNQTDIQEGDILVFFTDADGVTNIIIYRNILQIEAVEEE